MALDFNGSTSFATYGDLAAVDGLAAWSWCAWLWVFTFTNQAGIFTKDDSFILMSEGSEVASTLSMWTTVAGRASAQANDIVTGEWQHWSVAYNGAGATNDDKVKFRKNGVARTLSVLGTLTTTMASTAAALFLGKKLTTFGDFKMAHMRFWTTNLAANILDQERHLYFAGHRANLLIDHAGDDPNAIQDYSGRGNVPTPTAVAVGTPPPVNYGSAVMVL